MKKFSNKEILSILKSGTVRNTGDNTHAYNFTDEYKFYAVKYFSGEIEVIVETYNPATHSCEETVYQAFILRDTQTWRRFSALLTI